MIESLHSFISSLDDLSIIKSTKESFYNYNNPSEILFIESDDIIIEAFYKGEITTGEDIKNVFTPEFISQFPLIEPESINSKTFQIISRINNLCILHNINESIHKIILIENFILDHKGLNNEYADFLIGYCAFLRHSLIINSLYNDISKSAKSITWIECMQAKAEALANCNTCYLEKVVFALTWPEALSIWAIDCGIASAA